MPSSGLTKGLRQGWSPGEEGWGDEMNENLRLLNAYSMDQWAHDPIATVGLSLAYKGGIAIVAGAVSLIGNGVVLLTANQTNYVQRTDAGVVTANTTGWDADKIPMLRCTTDATGITLVEDFRHPIHSMGAGIGSAPGGLRVGGAIRLTGASTKIISGTSGVDFRDNTDANSNVFINAANGNVTIRGLLTAGTIDATKLTGLVPTASFPNPLPALSGISLTNLNAANLASGFIPVARFPAELPVDIIGSYAMEGSDAIRVWPAAEGAGNPDYIIYRGGDRVLIFQAPGPVNVLELDGSIPRVTINGDLTVTTGGLTAIITGRATGWGQATGTLTRTTFNTSTVTLQQLAERVAALIEDLHTGGNFHSLIGA
jgi:hypothetical protein